MYDVMSPKAEEFISDEEIQECLKFAEENKNNRELIEQIIEKARKMKGVSHKEAIVLLDCELEDLNEQIDFYIMKLLFIATKIEDTDYKIIQKAFNFVFTDNWVYQMVARTWLKSKIIDVHHISNDGYDNSVENLIYLERGIHNKVH